VSLFITIFTRTQEQRNNKSHPHNDVRPLSLHRIADTIQSAIAPVFLLAGIGAFLNVMVGRLARIVDRARNARGNPSALDRPEHDRHVWELRLIDRRISVINMAIFLCVSSALATCYRGRADVRLAAVRPPCRRDRRVAFVVSMLLLMTCLIYFLIEVRMSLGAIHVREELLELDGNGARHPS
jgi:hypothetical protein